MPFYFDKRIQFHTFRYLISALTCGLTLSYSLALPSYALVKDKNKPKEAAVISKPLSRQPSSQKIANATTGKGSTVRVPAEPQHPVVPPIDPAIAPSRDAQQNPPTTELPVRTEANPIHATSVHSLTLSDALKLAEENNPQLLAARKTIDVNQAGVGIANEIPNPQFSVQHFWGNIVALGTNGQAGVTQQIETAGKRKKRTAAAKSQVLLSVDQYKAQLWDIRSQTRQAYVQLAAAKENIDLIEAQSELAQNLVKIADKRVKAGAAPLSEQLQAELAYRQIDAQRIQALIQLRQAKGTFNSLLGRTMSPVGIISPVPIIVPAVDKKLKPSSKSSPVAVPSSKVTMAPALTLDNQPAAATSPIPFNPATAPETQTVSEDEGYDILDEGYFNGTGKTELVPYPSIASPDFNTLLKKAQQQRPDLVSALQQIRVNQDQLKLTRAQRIPDVYLSLGVPFLHVKDQFAPINGKNTYYGFWAQAAFDLPIYHNQKYEIRQGLATLQQSQLQVNAIQKQLVSDLYTAFQSLEGSKANINLYQQNLLPSSAEVLRLAQKSYQYGKTGLTSVIVAQQQIQQIRQNYIQSVLEYHNSWSSLEKTVGFKLDF
jgi:outer membrane protein TolC